MSNQRGVTLIELLAVIVIIGIIAAVAVPAVIGQINDAKTGADAASAAIIQDAADRYLVKNPDSTTLDVDTLVTEGYLKEAPTSQVNSGGTFTITVVNGKATVTPPTK